MGRGCRAGRARPDPELSGPRAYGHPAVPAFVERAVEWIRGSGGRPAAIVTPCTAVKPYPASPSAGRARGVLERLGLWDPRGPGVCGAPRGVYWLFLSDLLGLVPYELAHEYPACCYDVPPNVLWESREWVEQVAGAAARALEALAEAGVASLLAVLPSAHRRLLSLAASRARAAPEIEHIPYNIYRWPRRLEEALRRRGLTREGAVMDQWL